MGISYTPDFGNGGPPIAGYDNFANYQSSNADVTNPFISAKLLLNGHDRFAERDGNYFNLVQPYNHHTCIPNNPG